MLSCTRFSLLVCVYGHINSAKKKHQKRKLYAYTSEHSTKEKTLESKSKQNPYDEINFLNAVEDKIFCTHIYKCVAQKPIHIAENMKKERALYRRRRRRRRRCYICMSSVFRSEQCILFPWMNWSENEEENWERMNLARCGEGSVKRGSKMEFTENQGGTHTYNLQTRIKRVKDRLQIQAKSRGLSETWKTISLTFFFYSHTDTCPSLR